MNFSDSLHMWQITSTNAVWTSGLSALKYLASFGGISFTAGFLLTALQLGFAFEAAQRAKLLRRLAFTGTAALIHFSAWQIAPRLTNIFLLSAEGVTSIDRTVYVLRWIASLGGVFFTLAIMCLGLYAAFAGIKPEKRAKFYSGMISTFVGLFLFYGAWQFAPMLAEMGTKPGKVDDKPVEVLKTVGSFGGILFTVAFLGLALYLALGSGRSAVRQSAYIGLIFVFIGAFVFYSAWQFAPAIANEILAPPCASADQAAGYNDC